MNNITEKMERMRIRNRGIGWSNNAGKDLTMVQEIPTRNTNNYKREQKKASALTEWPIFVKEQWKGRKTRRSPRKSRRSNRKAQTRRRR